MRLTKAFFEHCAKVVTCFLFFDLEFSSAAFHTNSKEFVDVAVMIFPYTEEAQP